VIRIRLSLLLIALVAPGLARAGEVELERITNFVPWPRGVRHVDGKLYALARGVHRSAGGPNPAIRDLGGTLFVIDPNISEPVTGPDQVPGDAVRNNGKVFAEATSPPFHLYGGQVPCTDDKLTDRPYCCLVYDAPSKNFIVCGYSGLDLPKPRGFRKNATDSVLRFDTRDGKWHVIDQHDPTVVPESEMKKAIAPKYYPHHDVRKNKSPHGLVNGACGACVAGDYLYVGAKDNTALARYDLREIRKTPDAPPPPGEYVFHRKTFQDNVFLNVKGRDSSTYVEGTCAVEAHGGYLYVAFRTTSQLVRFPLNSDGSIKGPLEAEMIAQFQPWSTGGKSANIYDMTFDKNGVLYVSTGYDGKIWRFQPDPAYVKDFVSGYNEPFLDLEKTLGLKKTVNICFDDDGNFYVTSGRKELPDTDIRGAIYRVRVR